MAKITVPLQNRILLAQMKTEEKSNKTRRYTLISSRDPLLFELRRPGLKSIDKVEVVRTRKGHVEYSKRIELIE